MKIDRHNYEEYFLLYVDNELDAATRADVEAFAGRHPDLREELDLLLQFRAEPDPAISFPDKEQLLKTTSTEPIHAANVTEWLLLYADGELPAAGSRLVEDYLAKHPAAAAEWQILQQCRLQPEEILHPDKTSLYRQEEKVRVIGFRRWRMAAAILLLLLGAGTFSLLRQPGEEGQLPLAGSGSAAVPVSMTTQPNPAEAVVTSAPQAVANLSSPDQSPVRNALTQSGSPVTARYKNPVPQNPENANTETSPVRNEVAVQTPRDNQLPRPDFNPNVRPELAPSNRTFTADAGDPVVAVQNPPLTNPEVTNTNPQPSDIVQAAYTDDGFADNPGKKNKLRGFFRKVTRTFEKRTDIDPTDNNRLLVAGLSIRLK